MTFSRRSLVSTLFPGLFLIASSTSLAQLVQTTSVDIKGELLLEDLRFLEEKILETHQAPFTYCTESEFKAVFERARMVAATGLTYYQFAKLCAESMSVMRDSHSHIDYPALVSKIDENGGRFAGFTVYTDRRSDQVRMLIANDELGLLPEGAELVSINGTSVQQASSKIYAFAVAEGHSQVGTTRIKDALFTPLLPAIMDIGASMQVCVVPNGENRTICIEYPTHTRKEWKKIRRRSARKYPDTRQELYELDYHDSLGLAVMKIRSFAAGSQGKYSRFLRSSFRKLRRKEIMRLAIDLRDNTGGSSRRAEELFSYLAPEKVHFPANIIARQSPLAEQRIAGDYKGWKKFILKTFYRNNEIVRNYIRMAEMPRGSVDTIYYLEPHAPGKFPFQGMLQLWINGRSASASLNAAAAWKNLQLGPVIGEACLGPETGSWGNPTAFKLPNSGLVIDLSTIRFNADNTFRVVTEPLEPEHSVDYTADDLEQDKDPYLVKASELLHRLP